MSFLYGLLFSVLLAPVVRSLARRFGVVDRPDGGRKKHGRAVPLLGGAAVFLAFVLAVWVSRGELLGGFLLPKHLFGIALGGLVLVLGGGLDDRYRLPPAVQILFPSAAAAIVIASGIGMPYVTNPFGGVLPLDLWKVPVLSLGGTPYHLTLPGDLFTFAWLLVMMYTTKLLDGLDGLVSGLGVIGFTVIALLSLTPEVGQPELSRLAMAAAGASAGFLLFNGSPASIFLGEGGSTLIGFLLGVLAILSGGKIGITLLALAIPLLDAVWTVFRRVVLERRSFAAPDLGHLHFRLIASGLTERQAVLVYWLFSAGFGGIGLFIQGRGKLLALALLAAVFLLAAPLLYRGYRKGHAEPLPEQKS